jgi:polysaccharide export outer membrane protein
MITVLGDANRASPLAYYEGMRLTEALSLAGGFDTARGDRKDIRIIRGPLREPRVYTANLKALTSGKATDVVLAPGDIIYVTKSWYASTADVLNALSPIIALSQSVATFSIAYSIGRR